MQLIQKLFSDSRGATAIEYAFVASLISIAIVAAVALVGQDVQSSYDDTASQVEDAHNSARGD